MCFHVTLVVRENFKADQILECLTPACFTLQVTGGLKWNADEIACYLSSSLYGGIKN